MKNNKGTTPTTEIKQPETNIKPVTTSSSPKEQQKLSDTPVMLPAVSTGNANPIQK